jgi:hypothetical protein
MTLEDLVCSKRSEHTQIVRMREMDCSLADKAGASAAEGGASTI